MSSTRRHRRRRRPLAINWTLLSPVKSSGEPVTYMLKGVFSIKSRNDSAISIVPRRVVLKQTSSHSDFVWRSCSFQVLQTFLINIRRRFFQSLDVVIGKSSLGGSSNSSAIIHRISNRIRSAIDFLLIIPVKTADTQYSLETSRTVFAAERGVSRVQPRAYVVGDPDG